jgi:cysteine desulfurase
MAAAFRDIGPCQDNHVETSGSGIAPLRDALLARLCQNNSIRLSGHPTERLPHHLSVLVSDRHGQPMSGRALVRALDCEGIAASSGSACSSGRDSDSPILEAMGVDPLWRRSGLRLSLGYWIDPATVTEISNRIQNAIDRMNQIDEPQFRLTSRYSPRTPPDRVELVRHPSCRSLPGRGDDPRFS